MACGSHSSPHSVPVAPCCSSCPSPSRRISPARFSIPGRRQFTGGHIFRAVFLSSSHPPRLIVSSAPRIAVPSGRASRTAGGPRPGIVSPPRLVFAPSRPSCRRAGRFLSRLAASPRSLGSGNRADGAPFRVAHRGSPVMEKGAGFRSRPLVSFLFRCCPFVSRSYRRCSG